MIILSKQGKSDQDNLHLFRSFFLSRRVLGDSWGLHYTRGLSLVAFLSFSMTSGCLAFSEGLSEEVGTLAVLSLSTSTTSEAVSVLEPEGIDSWMVGGSRHSLPS